MLPMVTALLTLLSLLLASHAAVITDISPNEGSFVGGTIVRISGTGFERGGVEGTTTVTFGSSECVKIDYYSNDNVITCIAPASDYSVDTYTSVVVTLIQVDKAGTAACSTDCRFRYRSSSTPSLHGFFSDFIAGRLSTIHGLVRGSELSQFDIRIGNTVCDLEDDDNEEPVQATDYLFCRPNEQPAGRVDLSLRVDPSSSGFGYGLAQVDNVTRSYDLTTGAPYHVTVRPYISDISTKTAGSSGGSTIVITGSGFNPSDLASNVVHLGGVACSVTAVTETSLTCVTGARTDPNPVAAGYHSGPVGVLSEAWMDSTYGTCLTCAYGDARFPDSPSLSQATAQGATSISGGMDVNEFYADYYFQRMTTYFVAPVTTTYSFGIIADDRAELYLSTNKTQETMTRVAYLNGWTADWYNGRDMQWSDPVSLTAGERYYMDFRFIEARGGDGMDVGVRVAGADSWAHEDALFHSPREKTSFSFSTNATYEVQTLTLTGATSGTFNIHYPSPEDAKTTDPIAFDASADDVRSALNDIRRFDGCNSITVTREEVTTPHPGFTWSVTFNCPLRDSFAQLSILNNPSDPLSPPETLAVASTRTPSGSWVDGTFRLSVDGGVEFTEELDWDARWWEVRNALAALSTPVTALVGRGGNCLSGCTWTVRFVDLVGDVPDLVFDTSTMAGDGFSVSQNEIFKGDKTTLQLLPIPTDWLEVPSALPPVEVWANGFKAACDAPARVPTTQDGAWPTATAASATHCNFVYDDALVPTVTAISPTSGTEGATITLTGTNFEDGVATPVVMFGTAPCAVTAFTATSITCDLGAGPAGDYAVSVAAGFHGLATNDGGLSDFTYTVDVTAVSPVIGSNVGGTRVTLTGTGLSSSAAVTVDGTACAVDTDATDANTLVCVTAAHAAASGLAIAVDAATLTQTFEYADTHTPAVTTFTPTVTSAALTATATITLTNVNFAISTAPVVTFGAGGAAAVSCSSVTFTQDIGSSGAMTITCDIVRGNVPAAPQPSAQAISVYLDPLGLADVTGAPTLDRRLHVASVTPNDISLVGGAMLTITGAGFAAHAGMNTVTLHDHTGMSDVATCHVMTASATELTCKVHTHHSPASLTATATASSSHSEGGHAHSRRLSVTDVQAAMSSLSGPVSANRDATMGAIMNLLADASPSSSSSSSSLRRLATTVPEAGTATVTINELSSVCEAASGDCIVDLSVANTPVVTSMEVLPAGAGFKVVGTGLSPSAGSSLLFGTASCDLDTGLSSDTEAVCSSMPLEPASTSPVQALVAGKGYADIRSTAVNYTFPLTTSSLSVTTGSTEGGSTTVLTGTGFVPTDASTYSGIPATMMVMVGGVAATVVSATTTSVTFVTPANAGDLGSDGTAAAAVMVSVSSGWDGHSDSFTAMLPAAFTFDDALTPTVSSISPTSGARGTAVTITGAGFGDTQTTSTVVVGEGAPCAVTSWSATSIECTIGDAPAGRNKVLVDVEGWGYAKPASGVAFTGELTVGSLTSTSGGFGGGQAVTLDGTGFIHGRTHVRMCGEHVHATSTSYDSLTFLTPALDTRTAVETFDHRLVESMEGEWVSGSVSTSTRDRLADNDFETYATGWSGCWYGYDFGEHHRGVLHRARLYPRIKNEFRAVNAMIEGSDDGTTWTSIVNFGDRINAGWNWVDVDDATAVPAYRYLRYTTPENSCHLAELRFMGHKVSAYDDGVCSLSVEVHAEAHSPYSSDASTAADVTSSSYTYTTGATSQVTAVSPDQGTALGGTVLTITGTGFDTDHTRVSVTVNGVDCTVSASTATSITCTTGPRGSEFRDFTFEVTSPVTGTALLSSSTRTWFRYLDKWSSLSTWANNEPPVAGDTVVIPHGQAVVLDTSPPELFVLIVQGMLVFDHTATEELKLDATYIFIFGGVFEIGTEDNPFMGKATVTLHGDRWRTIELPTVGAKCLAVTDYPFVVHSHSGDGSHGMVDHTAHAPDFRAGVLDLHGAPRVRSWVKLDADVPAGGDTLTLGAETDWAVGDKLVVTSTERAVGAANAEEVTIVSVLSPTSVQVSPPLARAREATTLDYDGWTTVDMRPEVGLLSRNVVIQGDEGSDAQLFGVHTMAAHSAVYRVEGVEVRKCGQSGVLGRYCTHFHMMGSRPENYVRNNAIHHSFQRAVTVHASNDVQVAHNVAYHVRGHTYFVEDGNEERSLFDENLGVSTLKHGQLLKSDTKPATFWTPTPKCIWRHNVAAGSEAHGFWFELTGNPTGPSFTTSICPNKESVGGFFNNTFHSNRASGLRVYPFWQPHVDPCDADTDPAPQFLYNLTSWRNGGDGVFHRDVGSLHHVGYKLVENGGNEVFWKKLKGMNGMRNVSHYQHTLAIGSLDSGSPKTWNSAVWSPQEEYWYAGPMTFVNYGIGALRGCASCASQTALKQGGYTVRYEGLTFDNTPVRTDWTAPFKQILWDLDGSLTGIENGMVSPYWAFNDQGPSGPCKEAGAVYDGGILCDASAPLRRMQVDHVEPWQLDFQRLEVTGELGAGTGSVPFLPKELYGWVFPVVGGSFYHLHFASSSSTPIDWQTMKLRYSEPAYITDGEWVGVSTQFIDHRHEMEVMYGADWRPPLLDRLPTGADEHGIGAMGNVLPGGSNETLNSLAKTWHVVISTNNAYKTGDDDRYAFEISALQCPRLIGCPLPPPPSLGEAKMWSDPTAWPSGAVPVEGEAVTITNTMHIVLDVDPPRLGQMRIEGRLEFGDLRSTKLEADAIVVLGSMYVGTEDRPYYHEAKIVLHGIRTSPTVVVDSAHFLGNKNIAVFGELSMVGRAPTVTWTRLGAPAAAGDTTLTMSESVEGSWFAGQTIMLTPTEYDISEVEVVTIVGIRDAGLTLDIAPPLAHNHFQGTVPVAGGSDVTLSAAVGLLYRNVVVEGADPDLSTENYGAHVFVSEITREVDDGAGGTVSREFVGTALLRGVQFDHVGKMGSEHPSIKFKYTRVHDPPLENVVDRCAFSNAYNDGIVAESAKDLDISGNVIHGGFRSCFFFDRESTNAKIVDNLVGGTYYSPDFLGEWLEPIAAFYFDNTPLELRGNLATGAQDAGYTLRAPACSSDAYTSGRWGNNEAASVTIGAFLLSHSPDGRCVAWNDFTVWKAAHIGVLSVDMESNLHLDGLVSSDNHIGVSLNFFGGADTGNEATISNSVILGSTAASATCSASSDCRAVTEADLFGASCGSVLGSSWRRAGILSPQWTNRGKTCEVDGRNGGGLPRCRPPNRPERLCGLPWEKRYGLPSNNEARMIISNTRFAHWAVDDCGKRSAALVHNPSQIDWTPPIHVSGVTWDGASVEESAKLFFGTVGATPSICSASPPSGLGSNCDSYNFGILRDEDGTLSGAGAGTTLIPNTNPSIAAESPACSEDIEKGVFVCPAVQSLRPMVLRDRDRNAQTRRLGPIVITRQDPVHGNDTYYSIGPHDDGCAKRFFFPRYPWLIAPGYHYRMRASGTLPSHTRFYFTSDDPTESAVIALFLQKPNKVEFIVDGVKQEAQTTIPTLDDPAGTHVFDPHERHVYFVVRGGSMRYDLIRTPTIQLNVKLSVSIEEFFGDSLITNIATLLQIRPEQIKIVEVHAGSVEVAIEIVDDAPTAVEKADQEEQYERLTAIGDTITELVQDDAFDIGYELAEVPALFVPDIAEPVDEPVPEVIPPKPSPSPTASPTPGLTPSDSKLGIGLVVGLVVATFFVGAFAAFAFFRWKRATTARGHKIRDDRFHLDNPMHRAPDGTLKRIEVKRAKDGTIAPNRATLPSPKSGVEPTSSSNGWAKFWDSGHKRFYWYHAQTSVSQWTAPPGWVEPERTHDWHMVWDDTSQRPYFYNSETGETTFKTPRAIKEEQRRARRKETGLEDEEDRLAFSPSRPRINSAARGNGTPTRKREGGSPNNV